MKHKIVIEIPPYYIDTLGPMTLLICLCCIRSCLFLSLVHDTYTSKQRRLTTKKSFQLTIVVTYTSQLFWFLTDNLLCFERTFYKKLANQQQVSECSCSSQYKCSVSKASQRTFGLNTCAHLASNDSKPSFELRKKWLLNQQLRQFFEDKYLTSVVNFPTTAVKFCLFKRQICR
jgi:hypothetical protein